MFETEIIRIPIRPFGGLNAHLVRNAATCILIGTGTPGSEDRIARVFARHRLSFRDIKLIILTHAHADHAGNAARLRDLCGAPILAYEGHAEMLGRRNATTYCLTNRVGRLFRHAGLSDVAYRGFEPDIMMRRDEPFNLLAFAMDGVVRHIGGHTSGSVFVELASGDVVAGDLVASRDLVFGNRIACRSHENHSRRIPQELELLVKGSAARFHFGHGGPLGADDVLRQIALLRKQA